MTILRTLFVLVLAGAFQVIGGGEHAGDAVSTNSDSPKPRRLITTRMVRNETNQFRPTLTEIERSEIARRLELKSAPNAGGSMFGPYDSSIIAAVKNRWEKMVGDASLDMRTTGQVVLEFNLHEDGRVSELKVSGSTVSEIWTLYCQKAVLDPAPYARWPSEMRRLITTESRPMKFTFKYLAAEGQSKK